MMILSLLQREQKGSKNGTGLFLLIVMDLKTPFVLSHIYTPSPTRSRSSLYRKPGKERRSNKNNNNHSHKTVTGPVARFARQMAGHGYIVAAPSSYHEFTGPEPLAYDGPGTDEGNQYKIQKVSFYCFLLGVSIWNWRFLLGRQEGGIVYGMVFVSGGRDWECSEGE